MKGLPPNASKQEREDAQARLEGRQILPATLRHQFDSYRPVAHLWGAISLIGLNGWWDAYEPVRSPQHLVQFVGLASALAERAAQARLWRSKGKWQEAKFEHVLPADVALPVRLPPSCIVPTQLDVPPVHPEALKAAGIRSVG